MRKIKEVIKKQAQSFKYAFQGAFYMFKTESHAKFHLLAAMLTVALGFFFSLTLMEWCLIIICTFSVFAAEAFNTAIEELTNLVSPEHHPLAGRAKDVAAGAVLLTAIGAVSCGVLIFLPKILTLLFYYSQ